MKRFSCGFLLVILVFTLVPAPGPEDQMGSRVAGSSVYVAGSNQTNPSRRIATPRSGEVAVSTLTDKLHWGSFLGATSGNTRIFDVAVDTNGSIYVTGYSTGLDPGVLDGIPGWDQTMAGFWDAFACKFSPDGSTLEWFGYYGGGGKDLGTDITVNGSGCAFVSGQTVGGFTPKYGSFVDGSAFVFVISADGQTLDWDRGISGSGEEFARGVGVDSENYVYVAGKTTSADFPTTRAYDSVLSGSYDGFVTKIYPNGSLLSYSTYLGGSGLELVDDLVVVGPDAVALCGPTNSSDFPITTGVSYGGGDGDGFVAVLTDSNPSLPPTINSTFVGGSGWDHLYTIGAKDGSLYVGGSSASSDFPTTAGVYNQTFDGVQQGTVSKLNGSSVVLNWSTYLGGRAKDWVFSLDVGPQDESWVYVTGVTGNSSSSGDFGFPYTPGAFDDTGSYYAAFLSVLTEDGSVLKYSSVFDGGEEDQGQGVVAYNNSMNDRSAFVVGITFSSGGGDIGFPSTAGSFQENMVSIMAGFCLFVPVATNPPTFGTATAPSAIELGGDFTVILDVYHGVIVGPVGPMTAELVLDGTHYPMTNASDEYSATVPAVSEPSRSLTYWVKATDELGFTNTSASYSVRVGDVPNIEWVRYDSTIAQDDILWIRCRVSDSREGDLGVDKVNLTWGNTVYGMTEDADAPGNWSWYKLLTDVGVYSFFITAYDLGGNHNSTQALKASTEEAEDAVTTKTITIPSWWPGDGEAWLATRFHVFFAATGAVTVLLGILAGKIERWTLKKRQVGAIKRRAGL